MRNLFQLTTVILLILAPSFIWGDTILVFETAPGNGIEVDPLYGDNVSSETIGTFVYGDTDGEFTPNITVSYSPELRHWNGGYGDLTDVIFIAQNFSDFSIRITAELGYVVNLHRFELAGWPNVDYVINSVSVEDVCGDTLIFEENVEITGSLDATPAHTAFEFPKPLVSKEIVIRIDSTNLGTESDNIGIDNIRFSQEKTIAFGDLNQDGAFDLLDVAPFVDAIASGQYIVEADFNQDGAVNLLDVAPFIEALSCG